MSTQQKKLEQILEFLKKNSSYNKELQIKFAYGSIGHKEKSMDKLVALLYDTVNTQSQPKMGLLASFFKDIYGGEKNFDSFYGFVKYLYKDNANEKKPNEKKPFESLYEGLKSQDGWGEKTSALFVKNIYNYHYNFQQDKERKELKIWGDVPEPDCNDKLYLPVDSVIKFIFNKLFPKMNQNKKPKDWTFNEINKLFHVQGFSNRDIILFDDLWFWGFITQKVEGNKRELKWNGEKYWMIKESDKGDKIEEIKKHAEEFIKLLGT